MTPQDLLFIQAKVSNSFLRAFYPNDYRAMQRQMDKTNKSVNKETVNIKKTDRLTSDLNTKLSRVLGLLEREISDLAESVDNINLNSAEAPMNINIDVLGGAMDDAGGWMLGLLGLLRSIKKRAREREKVREEEEKKAKEEADKKAKEEAEADRKSKETSSENTKANEGEVKPPPETRAASDIKPSPTEVGGGRSLVEQGAAAADKMAAGTADEATIAIFKKAVKESTNPKIALSLLMRTGSFLKMSSSTAIKIIERMLGSKLIRYGSDILMAGLEAWDGWEETKTTIEAFNRGLIDSNQETNIITLICVEHGAKFVIGSAIGSIVAQWGGAAGAAGGAGVGAFFGGVGAAPGTGIGWALGEIVGFGAGYWMGSLAVEDVVKLFLGSSTIEEIIYGAAKEHAQNGVNQSTSIPVDQATPSLSPISTAQADMLAPGDRPASAAQLAQQVGAPPPAIGPARQSLPQAVPSPAPVVTPDLLPPNMERTTIDVGNIQQHVEQRLDTGGPSAQTKNTSNAAPTQLPPPTGTVLGTAKQYLGMSEGKDRQTLNSFIGQYFGPIDVASTPWCAAFTNSVLASNKLPSTGSAAALSFLNYGAAVWDAQGGGDIKSVQPGDIAVFSRGAGHGHVAFVESFTGDNITVLGGNQGDSSGGGGAVTESSRGTASLLGIRRPALAEGGKVHPKTGGTLTLVAEAGEPEYVVPQSKVQKFAHEMLAARPRSIAKSKKHTHVVVVPILT